MFHLQDRSAVPIYEQIVDRFKVLVAKKVMQPGEKLPSIRELASQLVVNPNTVSKAYQELERQGLIETFRGKGTFIASAATVPRMALERMNKLKDDLNHIAVEAKHLGLKWQEYTDMVKQVSYPWWEDEES